MKYFRLLLAAGLWLGAVSMAQAQGKLSGVVQDSATREPLAFASVFLANTTLGATTTEDGKFEFARVPAGTYDLVGSYVGYRLSKQAITVGKTPQQATLLLASTGQQLGEVVVQPEPNKPEDFQKFSALFLGTSTFAEQCRITNPEKVRVFYDDSTGQLTARARDFVQVDNDALGYRLKYYGLYFAQDEEDQSITYYGEPKFEELRPQDENQRQQWAANRLTAYRGSFMHFLRAVYGNRLRQDGFIVQRVGQAPNPRFRRADALRRALLAGRPEGGFSPAEQDSLTRWSRVPPTLTTLFPKARPIDSLRRVSTNGRGTFLRFKDELRITHFGEQADARFKLGGAAAASPTGSASSAYLSQRQVSVLRLPDGEAEIQADGSLRNPLEAAIGGYWGFEKIGEFLPLDYAPPAGK